MQMRIHMYACRCGWLGEEGSQGRPRLSDTPRRMNSSDEFFLDDRAPLPASHTPCSDLVATATSHVPLLRCFCCTAAEPEDAIGEEFNAAVPAGDLPSRALVECAVFAEDAERGGALVMHDLQSLDADEPPALDVVGRVVHLGEDGRPLPDAAAGAQPLSGAEALPASPTARCPSA